MSDRVLQLADEAFTASETHSQPAHERVHLDEALDRRCAVERVNEHGDALGVDWLIGWDQGCVLGHLG